MSTLVQEAEDSQPSQEEELIVGHQATPYIAAQIRAFQLTSEHQQKLDHQAAIWIKAIIRNAVLLAPEHPDAIDKWIKSHYGMIGDEDLVDKFADICTCVYNEEYLETLSKPSTWSVEGMTELGRAIGSASVWEPKAKQIVYQWLCWYDSPEKYSTCHQRVFRFAMYSGETIAPRSRSDEYNPLLKRSQFGDRVVTIRPGRDHLALAHYAQEGKLSVASRGTRLRICAQ